MFLFAAITHPPRSLSLPLCRKQNLAYRVRYMLFDLSAMYFSRLPVIPW